MNSLKKIFLALIIFSSVGWGLFAAPQPVASQTLVGKLWSACSGFGTWAYNSLPQLRRTQTVSSEDGASRSPSRAVSPVSADSDDEFQDAITGDSDDEMQVSSSATIRPIRKDSARVDTALQVTPDVKGKQKAVVDEPGTSNTVVRMNSTQRPEQTASWKQYVVPVTAGTLGLAGLYTAYHAGAGSYLKDKVKKTGNWVSENKGKVALATAGVIAAGVAYRYVSQQQSKIAQKEALKPLMATDETMPWNILHTDFVSQIDAQWDNERFAELLDESFEIPTVLKDAAFYASLTQEEQEMVDLICIVYEQPEALEILRQQFENSGE